jgi:glycosyltransferase involved in cell wall biosynthesis
VVASSLADQADGTIDVSVVVPVYNPGHYIEPCVRGLIDQTMARNRFEVIMIDDGSTDETPALLDRLAAEHDWIRVVHQPNSGWPGQPRNRGIDMARGEYIFFSDHDDRLGPEALERMVARARQTGADIVVPKGVSLGRPVAHNLFRANIDRAVLGVDPLSKTTTPHKLFRRAFLNEHDLRYPEGKRRLEDGVFVMAAYLRANVITVLADYPCYFRYARHDGQNTALQPWTADYYFPFVAEVIDVIEAGTEPGELRDSLLQRPYDGKMLGKLVGKRMLRWSPEQRQEIFDAVRRLALERFPADYHEHNLPIIKRAHACALVANRLDRMVAVATNVAAIKARARIHRLSWDDDAWIAELDAELLHADGTPVTVSGGGQEWRLDTRLIPADLAGSPHRKGGITSGKVDVTVTHRRDKVEWWAASDTTVELVPRKGDGDLHRVIYRTTVRIDPATLAGGAPLSPGRWDVRVRVAAWGLEDVCPVVRAPRAKATVSLTPALFADAGLVVTPELKPPKQTPTERTLRLQVRTSAKLPVKMVLHRVRDLTVTPDGELSATVNLAMSPSAAGQGPDLVLLGKGGVEIARRTATVIATQTGSVLRCDLTGGASRRLPSGRIRIAVKAGKRVRALAAIRVDRHRRVVEVERRKPKRLRPWEASGTRTVTVRRTTGRRLGSRLASKLRLYAA